MRLLIVGALGGHITAATQIAMARGAKVAQADTVDAAMAAVRSGHGAELVMCDITLDIGALVDSLRRERISIPVVACGVNADAAAAVSAIKSGAKEYVPLPPEAMLIAAVLEAVAEESHQIVHRDPATADVLTLAELVAPSDASVLVCGESGTGKELVARYIHRKSRRAAQRFVAVNCAAIPENLLESELFGHEKGAFTGAVARRVGKFEEANGGTLLLDEISEMELRMQAKLLRVIQEREIDRVGGNTPVKIDVRLVATTNRELTEEVAAGRFREDLFFRLNVMTLLLPPLRERRGDLLPLAEYFIAKYSDANGVEAKPLSESARNKLMAHSWRGNIRELENTIHRGVLLARGDEIDDEAIMLTAVAAGAHQALSQPAASADTDAGVTHMVGHTVAEVERDLIIDTLKHCLGNRTHAATILGISIRTLRNKLKLYIDDGVSVPLPGEAERRFLVQGGVR